MLVRGASVNFSAVKNMYIKKFGCKKDGYIMFFTSNVFIFMFW